MRGVPVLLILLAGCASQPTRPVVVEIPGPKVYVAIPETMTRPCPVAMPRNRSPLEAVRVAVERRKGLEDCNRKLKAIDAIDGTTP